jgi:hypothetical protein
MLNSLKDLYLEVTTALELTYRPQQLYLSEIILEQLMHNDKVSSSAVVTSRYKSFNEPLNSICGTFKSCCFL